MEEVQKFAAEKEAAQAAAAERLIALSPIALARFAWRRRGRGSRHKLPENRTQRICSRNIRACTRHD